MAPHGSGGAEPTVGGDIIPLSYTLDRDGNVSAAVYDQAGRQIRTLLSAEPQTAGVHTIAWDGLDRDGRPAPQGEYAWRLVRSQTLRAEYLLSLGTSVGIHHWPGQHGGPNAVALDGDAIIVGGHPEGSPLLCKAKLDGTYVWPSSHVEPAKGTLDLAVDGGKLYGLMESGNLYTFQPEDGKKTAGPVPLLMAVKPLGGVGPNRDKERTLTFDVGDGNYLVRLKVGQAPHATAPLDVRIQEQSYDFPALKPGEFRTEIGPRVYNVMNPVAAKDGKLTLRFTRRDDSEQAWAVESMELVSPASRLDARGGEVLALFSEAGAAAWVDPADGRTLDVINVPRPVDAALAGPGEALVLCADRIVRVTRRDRQSAAWVDGLTGAQRLAIDPGSGEVLVVEGGESQQIKRFDKQGRLLATFGRKGGRRPGIYHPEDFLAVAAIAADGRGGFVVCEALSAPRRTARFDRQGKLLREWYGGQQFYTFAAPDPANPALVWMDSQWNWLMQVEVDYAACAWKVRACYEWNRELDPLIFPHGKMAARMFPFHADLADDGRAHDYLWFQNSGLIVRVDESAGRMVPVASLGRMIPNQFWNWHEVPAEQYPQAFKDALAARGVDYRKRDAVKGYLGYGWADANGNGRVDADELRLYPPEIHRNGHGFHGGPPCLWLDEQCRIYAAAPGRDRPAYEIRSPVGRTRTGAPLWDWASPITSGPVMPARGSRFLRKDAAGNLYQLLGGGGDGFAGGLDSFHSHGAGWPGTLVDRTAIVKYGPQGEVLWQAGNHAARWDAPRGQVHHPACIAGFVKGCVGVCDYFIKPCHFWTEDGLYLGDLLDGRVDDGLPARVYSWWRADRQQGDEFETNLALFQYDMLVGGSLAQLPGGDVVFLGAGWNNVPVYRVHGLDGLSRQQGSVRVEREARAADGKGTGLLAEYFGNADLEGEPVLRRADACVWFDVLQASNPRDHAWRDLPVIRQPFSARWSGQLEPRFSEAYTLAVYLRGRARLWVGGVPLIDCWEKPSPGDKRFAEPVALEAGRKYPVVLEFASAGVERPEVHLCWESPTQSIEHVPADALYPEAPPLDHPTVRLEPAEQAAEKGGRAVSVTVRRQGPRERPLVVRFAARGNAVAGEHYQALSGRVAIPAHAAAASIEVIPGDNRKPELTKTLLLAVMPDPTYQADRIAARATVYLNDSRARPIPAATILEASGKGKEAADVLLDAAGFDRAGPLPTHDTDAGHMWLSGGWQIPSEYVVIDLGTTCDLSGFRLWNYNRDGLEKPGVPYTNHGIRELEVLAGLDPAKLTSCGVYPVEEAPGCPGYAGQLVELHTRARYVRLNPRRTWAQHGPLGVPGVGMSKIVFYGVDAP